MLWNPAELDLFFISYDEPNAEQHFQALAACAPRAPQRIHGIQGLHRAYAAAAAAASTPRFITVDADSIVFPESVFGKEMDDHGLDDVVLAFCSRNTVNGLVYGNGGMKCWPRRLLLEVPTHEAVNSGLAQVDFHFLYRYWRMPIVASENHFAASGLHAFRAGYRESIKLSLVRGRNLERWDAARRLMSKTSWSRLMIWISVGMDVPNGPWAILGARMGLVDFWLDRSIKANEINDYARLANIWSARTAGQSANDAIGLLDGKLASLGVVAPVLDPQTSAWFKDVYVNVLTAGIGDLNRPSPMRG